MNNGKFFLKIREWCKVSEDFASNPKENYLTLRWNLRRQMESLEALRFPK